MSQEPNIVAHLSNKRIEGTLLGVEEYQTPEQEVFHYAHIVPSGSAKIPEGTILKVLLPKNEMTSVGTQKSISIAHGAFIRNNNDSPTLKNFQRSASDLKNHGIYEKAEHNLHARSLHLTDSQGERVRISASDMKASSDWQPSKQAANWQLGQRSLAFVANELTGNPTPYMKEDQTYAYEPSSLYDNLNQAIQKHGTVIQVAIDNFVPIGNELDGGGHRHPMQAQHLAINDIDGSPVLENQNQNLTVQLMAGVAGNMSIANDPVAVVRSLQNIQQKSNEGDQLILKDGLSSDQARLHDFDEQTKQTKVIYQLDAGNLVNTTYHKHKDELGRENWLSFAREFQEINASALVCVATDKSMPVATNIDRDKQGNVLTDSLALTNDSGGRHSPSGSFTDHLAQFIKNADQYILSESEKNSKSNVRQGLVLELAGQSNNRMHMAMGAYLLFEQDNNNPAPFSEQIKQQLGQLLNLTHPTITNYIPPKELAKYIDEENIKDKVHTHDQSYHNKLFRKYVDIVDNNKSILYAGLSSWLSKEHNQDKPEYQDLSYLSKKIEAYQNKEETFDGKPVHLGCYTELINYAKNDRSVFTSLIEEFPDRYELNRSMENLVMAVTQTEKEYLGALAVYLAIQKDAEDNGLVKDGVLTLGRGDDAFEIQVGDSFVGKKPFKGFAKSTTNTFTLDYINEQTQHNPAEKKRYAQYNQMIEQNGWVGKKIVLDSASSSHVSNAGMMINALVVHAQDKVAKELRDKTSPLNNPTIIMTPTKLFNSSAEPALNLLLNSRSEPDFGFNSLQLAYPELSGIQEAIVPSGQGDSISKMFENHLELHTHGQENVIESEMLIDEPAYLTRHRNNASNVYAATKVLVGNDAESSEDMEATRTVLDVKSANQGWSFYNYHYLPNKLIEVADIAKKRQDQGHDIGKGSKISDLQLYELGVTKTQINRMTMSRATSAPSWDRSQLRTNAEGEYVLKPADAIPGIVTSSEKGQVLAHNPIHVGYYLNDQQKIVRFEYTNDDQDKVANHYSYIIRNKNEVMHSLEISSAAQATKAPVEMIRMANHPNAEQAYVQKLFACRYTDENNEETRDVKGRLQTNWVHSFEPVPDPEHPYVSMFDSKAIPSPLPSPLQANQLGAEDHLDWGQDMSDAGNDAFDYDGVFGGSKSPTSLTATPDNKLQNKSSERQSNGFDFG